jgi:hypothetical protein
LFREGRSDAPTLIPQGQREHSHRHDRDLGYPLRQEDDRTNDQGRRDDPQQRVEDKNARTDSQPRHGGNRTITRDQYHPGEPSNLVGHPGEQEPRRRGGKDAVTNL